MFWAKFVLVDSPKKNTQDDWATDSWTEHSNASNRTETDFRCVCTIVSQCTPLANGIKILPTEEKETGEEWAVDGNESYLLLLNQKSFWHIDVCVMENGLHAKHRYNRLVLQSFFPCIGSWTWAICSVHEQRDPWEKHIERMEKMYVWFGNFHFSWLNWWFLPYSYHRWQHIFKFFARLHLWHVLKVRASGCKICMHSLGFYFTSKNVTKYDETHINKYLESCWKIIDKFFPKECFYGLPNVCLNMLNKRNWIWN